MSWLKLMPRSSINVVARPDHPYREVQRHGISSFFLPHHQRITSHHSFTNKKYMVMVMWFYHYHSLLLLRLCLYFCISVASCCLLLTNVSNLFERRGVDSFRELRIYGRHISFSFLLYGMKYSYLVIYGSWDSLSGSIASCKYLSYY